MWEPQQDLHVVGRGGSDREYVDFWPSGAVVKGRFRCTACGMPADVTFVLPRCVSCDGRLWEREESSPYVEVR